MAALFLVAAVLWATLASCGAPGPTQGEDLPSGAHGEATAGFFSLVLDMSASEYRPGQKIEGRTEVRFSGLGIREIGGSGSGLVALGVREVNGTRVVGPFWTADCHSYEVSAVEPIIHDIVRSGAILPNDPDEEFYRDWFMDGTLPAGSWELTAMAHFLTQPDCAGPATEMSVPVVITVRP